MGKGFFYEKVDTSKYVRAKFGTPKTRFKAGEVYKVFNKKEECDYYYEIGVRNRTSVWYIQFFSFKNSDSISYGYGRGISRIWLDENLNEYIFLFGKKEAKYGYIRAGENLDSWDNLDSVMGERIDIIRASYCGDGKFQSSEFEVSRLSST